MSARFALDPPTTRMLGPSEFAAAVAGTTEANTKGAANEGSEESAFRRGEVTL